ncbi:hypothetical protein Smp_137500 [Schistosoma mansoni]|uniref:hypothetical protein n=1 Tax=Schistosoma mansoni TaxID=6183 RepID=UPI0001A63471|nr:hypothetical protein Smp_137500 [Schistosoma mansoni]|eukprot:XP_018645779.1 hypothetical protein Smp_137500 [Schistosoma mansoni]
MVVVRLHTISKAPTELTQEKHKTPLKATVSFPISVSKSTKRGLAVDVTMGAVTWAFKPMELPTVANAPASVNRKERWV